MAVELRRLAGYWPLVWFGLAAVAPLLGARPYLLESLLQLHLLLIFVLSWDLFCGPTRETNFGHSFFVGGAAYLAAWLQSAGGLGLWSAALLALLATLATGGAVGWIADRFRGPSFALLTMGVQLMLFQAVFLFPSIFGGEEGISGLPQLAASRLPGYYVVLVAAAAVAWIRSSLLRSRAGLLLVAVGEDEELARSSGVTARRLKVAVFCLSATLGGLGGILYLQTQGQVNAELAGSALSVQIVLLGLVGGARSGPLLGVLLFFVLQRAMAGLVAVEGVLYAAVLLAAVVLFPHGIVPHAAAGER